MTLKYRVLHLLARKPQSARQLADAHGLVYASVSAAFYALSQDGAIDFVRWENRCAIYRATGKPVQGDGRGRAPGSAEARKLGPLTRPKVKRIAKPSEHRGERPPDQGYGSGRIALEAAWPVQS